MAFWDKDKIATTDSGITIRSVREDRPKFKREYSAEVGGGRSLKITIYTMYGDSRFASGELKQRDGKWLLFEPERVHLCAGRTCRYRDRGSPRYDDGTRAKNHDYIRREVAIVASLRIDGSI